MQHKPTNLALVLATCSACLSSAAFAETGFRPTPTAFVLDSRTQSIRPVIGHPGAWFLDLGLNVGMPVLAARFSLERDFALILGGSDTAVSRPSRSRRPTPSSSRNKNVVAIVTGLLNGQVSVTPIEGALSSANVLVLNNQGTAALLYSEADHQVQFLGGLPGQPVAGGTVSVDELPGKLTTLALNSAGDLALVGVTDGFTGSVYRLTPDRRSEFVTPVQRASAIAFASDENAFVTDSEAGQVLRIDARSGGGATMVAGSSRGIRRPESLQVLSSTRILVAQTDDDSITCLDLSFGVDSRTVVPVPPGSMDRFPGNYLVLNQPGNGPVYVLETGSPAGADCTQKVWFIPAD